MTDTIVKLFCRCGAMFIGHCPDEAAGALAAEWHRVHSGKGHGEATQGQAARARWRVEDRRWRQIEAENRRLRSS